MSDRIDRRQFGVLALSTVGGAMLSLSGCASQKKTIGPSNQLNIYSWADYLHPDVIPKFQSRYGIKVVYDTFASNESLLAKLQAGASDYDIVVPTGYMVKQLNKLNILDEIDHSRLKNLGNIMDRFANPGFDPAMRHSVPYMWGTTGIAYNNEALSQLGYVPEDWDVFWDKRFNQRMTLLDDSRETIGLALKRHGDSYNCTDREKIRRAVDDLKTEKPLVMCYTSDQVIVQLASGDSHVSLAYSGDAYQAARDNNQVKYVIPQSGASIWMDSMCIPKGAPHMENAYKWIDFLLEPEISAATANYTRYATPNKFALPKISEEQRRDKNLYPPEAILDKCEQIADVGSLIFYYDQMWTELKCS